MSSLDRDNTYWRSLQAFEARLDSDPALRSFVESEFPEQAADLSDPVSRRRFMQLMGASMALAGVVGTAGCQRWEREEIVPLSRRPEDYVPGNASHYATALEIGGVAEGLVVTAFDGRPIKVEGNPQHPFSGGASSTFAQASVLHLYDPDRSMQVRHKDGVGGWDEVEALIQGVAQRRGAGLRILSEASSSPTLARLRAELVQRYPSAKWYEYEPLGFHNEQQGLAMAGLAPADTAIRAMPMLAEAKRIVAVEADLFGTHPSALRFARDYAAGRRSADLVAADGRPQASANEAMNRLYAVESTFTTAGVAADHRLPLAVSHLPAFLDALSYALSAVALRGNAGISDPTRLVDDTEKDLVSIIDGGGQNPQAQAVAAAVKALTKKSLRFVAALAQDLYAHARESVLVAGPNLTPEVHARVARLNATLAANGRTVQYVRLPGAVRGGAFDDISALVSEMNAGQVETLVMLGGNPVYDAPADLDFGVALTKVGTSLHLGEYDDETSVASTWHLPRVHYLESWGDCRSYDGTYSLIQPLIEPMWRDDKNRPGKSPIELVAMLLGRQDSGQALVRETFDQHHGGLGDGAWRKAVHDGFVAGTAYPPAQVSAPQPLPSAEPAQLGTGSVELVFLASPHAHDGRFANNGWLQETPDFITKLTWDNAALINPNTAEQLGVSQGELISVTVGKNTVELPVYTLPGQARSSIAVALGHGRTRAGRIAGAQADGVASTGFDAYPLRTTTGAYATVVPAPKGTGKSYSLVTTQDHWDFHDSQGRRGVAERLPSLVREATAEEYRARPAVIAEREHAIDKAEFLEPENGRSLWDEHQYPETRGDEVKVHRHKWGMAIDLDKCTGCNSCMVACQAENNVPIVGKEQVAKSREMHWIRIDRYFGGDNLRDNPVIAHQPIACQQCENAPCEQVCPVGATIHSSEGLNDMVYNRCVGTRYCLNNCPYRVRRFNFMDYLNRPEAPGGGLDQARNRVRELIFNPEVTVRSRGVMEKCTFCVQRIQAGKIAAKNEGRDRVGDGEVVTACQQACPTNAIVFGDLTDPDSAVSKAHAEKRSYALLASFNTRPRNLFLARIRNPHEALG
ncbi:TAT-variant-translocated molybdopterin oxidoreductase [Haliangium sp.]|uniref:TAT-variant-translocated molybdopterin oxidoreductase n=1 Tax=Haliangium sp. TaxID=2663208 RepID=UPI003D0C29E2